MPIGKGAFDKLQLHTRTEFRNKNSGLKMKLETYELTGIFSKI
jgi:hypothetical protein